jgi:hypothetical protein
VPVGGPGGSSRPLVSLDPYQQALDVQYLNRALKGRWEIPDTAMKAAPHALLEIIFSRAGDKQSGSPDNRPYRYGTRSRLRALTTLIRMRQQNLSQKFVESGGREGALTLHEIVQIVEEDRRAEVIDDRWLAARGFGPEPK